MPTSRETRLTLISRGAERTHREFVPPSAESGEPLALVIDLHALAGTADQQEAITGMEGEGAAEGFVVVTPQGLGAIPFWDYTASDPTTGDLAYIDDLIDDTGERLCIDLARVYATGLSHGALMASALACRLPHRIAAVSVVAGLAWFDDCAAHRAVALQVIYGTGDPVLPFGGGLGAETAEFLAANPLTENQSVDAQHLDVDRATFPPVRRSMADWAALGGCGREAGSERISEEVARSAWAGCTDGGEVVLYTVEGGGHTWPGIRSPEAAEPGLGPTTDDIDATALAWAFFRAHPRSVAADR